MGKTLYPPIRRLKYWKHPHKHGEDRLLQHSLLCCLETPPQAWGRPPVIKSLTASCRNTPTSMGKTGQRRAYCRLDQKHPHKHGEDKTTFSAKLIQPETPPQAWGRLATTPKSLRNQRNTPTSMGKTHRVFRSKKRGKKHPHKHGEDRMLQKSGENRIETPPQAWGRLYINDTDTMKKRNTPTSMGKTVQRPPLDCI